MGAVVGLLGRAADGKPYTSTGFNDLLLVAELVILDARGNTPRSREGIMAKRVHTQFNRFVLETKDLSMFPIKRVVTESEKYWEVSDLRKGKNYVRKYRTKFQAELAICSVVAIAIGDDLGSEVK
jgi:hypothetical protein